MWATLPENGDARPAEVSWAGRQETVLVMNMPHNAAGGNPCTCESSPWCAGDILETHVEYLAARGVTIETAIQAGLRSVDEVAAAKVLGVAGRLAHGGLAIPYPGVDYVRVRMDSGNAKFLSPAGKLVPIYIPPGCPAKGAEPITIVEGPIKALALQAQGIDAVALGGTPTCLTTDSDRRLNESWRALNLSKRVVVIVFDSNRRTNCHVARDEARLAMALERAGAEVKLANLPHRSDGEAWGPDDFLVQYGADELRKVIADAVAADPIRRVLEVLA